MKHTFETDKVVCESCEAEYMKTQDNQISPDKFEYCPQCGVDIDAEIITETRTVEI